jgi:hypothetical protein
MSKRSRKSYQKPESVRELENFANGDSKQKHAGFPDYAFLPRRFKDDTKLGLRKCIQSYINLKGGSSATLPQRKAPNQKERTFTVETANRGNCDITAVYKGQVLLIDILSFSTADPKKYNQPTQNKFFEIYFIARNFSEFKAFFDTL